MSIINHLSGRIVEYLFYVRGSAAQLLWLHIWTSVSSLSAQKNVVKDVKVFRVLCGMK